MTTEGRQMCHLELPLSLSVEGVMKLMTVSIRFAVLSEKQHVPAIRLPLVARLIQSASATPWQ